MLGTLRPFFAPFLVIFSVLLTGCPSEDPVGPDQLAGKIEVGTRSNDAIFDVGSGGVTVRITQGDITGLRITIPQNAFDGSRSFTISSAPITSHTYGAALNVLTPLIRLDYGGGYAQDLLRVDVPINLPPGHFAMAFLYDEASGELEGLPPLALTDTSISVLTAHLSGRHLSDGTKGGILGSKTYVDLLIASIAASELQGIQSTGFVPGTDDWEFTNFGSYLAPKGHCAGQSVSAMWYWSKKKQRDNASSLHGRYDLISGAFWQDNPRGYRFASTVQEALDWDKRDTWLTKFETTGQSRFPHDSLHYLSFVYGIKATGKPQYVGIRSATGGHAMIAYKAGGNKIWVADPNYPGNVSRTIELQGNGSFTPYMSGPNADDLGTPYPHINYIAKTSLISHEGIDALWKKVEDGTIGKGVFPSWQLYVRDAATGDYVEHSSDTIYSEPDGTVSLQARCTSCAYGWEPTEMKQDIMLISTDYTLLASAQQGTMTISVKEGASVFAGLYVMSQVGTDPKTDSTYLDFRWLTIIRPGMSIVPSDTTIDVGEDVTFTVRTNGTAPSSARYTWYFSDLDDEVVVNGDSTYTRSFQDAGDISVGVILSDRSTGKNIDTAEAKVRVGTAWTKLYIQIADFTIPASEPNRGPLVFSDGSRANYLTFVNGMDGLSPACNALTWSGESFSAAISCEEDVSAYVLRRTGNVTGRLNATRTMLLTATMNITTTITFDDNTTQTVAEQSITITNLPITYIYGAISGPGAVVRGTAAQQYVSAMTYTIPSTSSSQLRYIDHVDWGSGETKLTVVFTD